MRTVFPFRKLSFLKGTDRADVPCEKFHAFPDLSSHVYTPALLAATVPEAFRRVEVSDASNHKAGDNESGLKDELACRIAARVAGDTPMLRLSSYEVVSVRAGVDQRAPGIGRAGRADVCDGGCASGCECPLDAATESGGEAGVDCQRGC